MTFFSQGSLIAALLVGAVACGGSGRKSDSQQPAPAHTDGVSSEDLARTPTQSPEELLRGRVSGVTITPTSDGGIAVRIRGGSSIYGSNDPLYIVDGVPFEPGPNGALSGIPVTEIESIRVLKDATDTAMYGVRGSNGVIVIKTKQANRRQKPKDG